VLSENVWFAASYHNRAHYATIIITVRDDSVVIIMTYDVDIIQMKKTSAHCSVQDDTIPSSTTVRTIYVCVTVQHIEQYRYCGCGT